MIHPRGMVSVYHFQVTKKGPAHHMFSALPQPEDLPKLFPLDCSLLSYRPRLICLRLSLLAGLAISTHRSVWTINTFFKKMLLFEIVSWETNVIYNGTKQASCIQQNRILFNQISVVLNTDKAYVWHTLPIRTCWSQYFWKFHVMCELLPNFT